MSSLTLRQAFRLKLPLVKNTLILGTDFIVFYYAIFYEKYFILFFINIFTLAKHDLLQVFLAFSCIQDVDNVEFYWTVVPQP